jgi:hypothetical protein
VLLACSVFVAVNCLTHCIRDVLKQNNLTSDFYVLVMCLYSRPIVAKNLQLKCTMRANCTHIYAVKTHWMASVVMSD